MTCRTCIHWELLPGESARKRVGRRCLAPLPDAMLASLPVSITRYHQFHWPPPRQSMWAADGEGCPTHEPREKA